MIVDLLNEEHGPELALGELLSAHLRGLRHRLAPKKVSHYQHYVFSDRAASLANYLDAAVILTRQQLYCQAFAVLRAALEHHVMDLLLFLGRRYVQDFKQVDDATWQDWQQARERGDDWTRDIVAWQRTKQRVEIIRSGPHLRGGAQGPRAMAVSQYYFLMDDFDPVAGTPGRQKHLATGFDPGSCSVRHAKANQEIYTKALKWSALKRNLRINRLYSRRALAHLDVHYTFLSAFVHPTSASFRMVYGHNASPSSLGYDHYAAELCLMYGLVIARNELNGLRRMSMRAPRVQLTEWDDVQRDLVSASRHTAHLWFPPDGKPHMFDRIEDANRRAWGSKSGGKVPDPRALPERGIRYYRDPLRRLVRMHSSSHEFTTGLVYRSPWERADAGRRV